MIYINGDSWSQRTPFVGDDYIWPTLISNKLNLPLVNQAVGCGNNFRISDDLENLYLENYKPDLIILGLTTPYRDYISAAEMSHWNVSHGFAKREISGDDDPFISKWWVTNAFDPLESVYRYYKNLQRLHELCSKFDCPYFMFQVWDHELAEYNILGGDDNIANFLKQYYTNENAYFSKRYFTAFKTLTELSKNWNYVEQPLTMLEEELDDGNSLGNGHPNQQGHARIADFVYQHVQPLLRN